MATYTDYLYGKGARQTGRDEIGKQSVFTGYDDDGNRKYALQPIYKPVYSGGTSQQGGGGFSQPAISRPYGGGRSSSGSYSGTQAMKWVPQSVSGQTTTSERTFGALPTLPGFVDIDEDKLRSRTQELSALGRHEASSNFQDLLSRIYGANPDDPYAKNLARKASAGFSMDTQRAISEGGREALSIGLSEQQQENQRQMTAYNAAVNAVLASGKTTTTQTYQYSPTPMQSIPSGVSPNASQLALTKNYYDPSNPYSLGQPYTLG